MDTIVKHQLLYEVKEYEVNQLGSWNYEHPCLCCHGPKDFNHDTIKKTLETTWSRSLFQIANGGTNFKHEHLDMPLIA